MMPYYYFKPSKPKEAKDGLKARSQRGAFAKNWWGQRWISALELLLDSGRLSRGRRYARKGQVISIDETKRGIVARVQGSRSTPYKVKIQIAPLSDAQWETVIDTLAEQAIFAAQLLAGEMPQDIESVFETANAHLFPAHYNDLITDCSCPDYANPCKHIAATHFILGERLDEDPFLIFRLRGRTQKQVMAALSEQRMEDAENFEDKTEEQERVIPLEDQMEHFWTPAALMDEISVSIHTPNIEMPLLKRLGEASFVPAPGLASLLREVYEIVSQNAIAVAYQETDR